MKILIVSRGQPELSGGLGIFEWDQAKALRDLGVDVAFCVIDLRSVRRKRRMGYLSARIDGIRVFVNSLPIGAVNGCLLTDIGSAAFPYVLSRIEREWGRPDVIHAHFTDYGCMVMKEAGKKSIPYVITEHSSAVRNIASGSAYEDRVRRMYTSAAKTICVSSFLAGQIGERFAVTPCVIGNIVDSDLFVDALESRRPHERFVVASAGGLNAGKRMDRLIEAFCRTLKPRGAELVIFGEGAQRGSLEALIAANDAQESVRLRGQCSREEMARQYALSDCFALVSDYETFGVAYVEALCAGLPVIATRCGGPEDFVTPENGLMVPVDDAEALDSALDNMYNSSESFPAESLSNDVRGKFGGTVIGGELISLYSKIAVGGQL